MNFKSCEENNNGHKSSLTNCALHILHKLKCTCETDLITLLGDMPSIHGGSVSTNKFTIAKYLQPFEITIYSQLHYLYTCLQLYWLAGLHIPCKNRGSSPLDGFMIYYDNRFLTHHCQIPSTFWNYSLFSSVLSIHVLATILAGRTAHPLRESRFLTTGWFYELLQ